MLTFWNVIWYLLATFALVAYLMVMFSIVTDLFRDKEIGGISKALWIVALVFLPMLTALAYLVVHGDGMALRQEASYVRQVAGSNPAEQIATAKRLLDDGTLSRDEFDTLKARALATA